ADRVSLFPTPRPPRSTLFPYTTLFRSVRSGQNSRAKRDEQRVSDVDVSEQRERRPEHHGPESDRSTRAGAQRGQRRKADGGGRRSEEHTSELQSLRHLVCRLLLEKKKR